jgi:hypothetical protein
MHFDGSEFLAEHLQWSHSGGYLKARPAQPWSLFAAGEQQARLRITGYNHAQPGL